jgi:hypothetical protein
MEPLLITGSEDNPEVILDKQKGTFELSGRSLPEDVIQFYAPVYSWLEQYVAEPNEESTFKMKVDYFNSASQRAINEIFNILSRIPLKGKKIKIEWHYYEDDYEMKESGEEYADLSNLPFKYVSHVPQ